MVLDSSITMKNRDALALSIKLVAQLFVKVEQSCAARGLSEEVALVAVLRIVGGLDSASIARVRGKSEGAVKSQLKTARRRLGLPPGQSLRAWFLEEVLSELGDLDA